MLREAPDQTLRALDARDDRGGDRALRAETLHESAQDRIERPVIGPHDLGYHTAAPRVVAHPRQDFVTRPRERGAVKLEGEQ